ncbi:MULTISPECIES: hypothetical protein [unclassified Acinetobacter]|uniref:hypothetical protein n=1 Tax=unclassified Acinetobacter TaxID=196816 RepID=UPI00103F698D|nr:MULTISPECIES: hypothetical protein [unclassified Acinetobacter]TCB20122.1 hypothetical protein E0H79_04505 [Acinetobacter sp. ANC 5045]
MQFRGLTLCLSAMLLSVSVSAAPMPNSIVVKDKAIVPILKTEVIRTVTGEKPIRHVEATIFEVSNQGKDIVAKEVVFDDDQAQFSEKQLGIPVIQKGGVIVPTSKIELNKTLKQDGKVISEVKTIDAEGMEYKQGQAPIHRTLKLDRVKTPESKETVSHAVFTEDGKTTRDVVVVEEEGTESFMMP